MSYYNILSLDGGGIRGVITTRIMSWVESRLQDMSASKEARLADYFDFFIGTSTGGLMAACYLMPDDSGERPRYSAVDVEKLYLDLGGKIFSLNLWQKVTRGHGVTSAKYPPDALEKILMNNFNDTKLSDLLKPCVITAFDMKENRQLMFRRHRAFKQAEENFYVRDVCRATTSAPTYFPPCVIKSMTGKEYLCIDGGIFGPNPALFGYAELRRVDEKASASNMLMLSLGTGDYKDDYPEKEVVGWGKLEWYRPMVQLMSSNNVLNTDFQMKMVFRDSPNNYLRADPLLVNKEHSSLDLSSKENLKSLRSIADDHIKNNQYQLEQFIEKVYKSRRNRPTNPFDEIMDVPASSFWHAEYPQGVPTTIDADAYPNLNAMVDEAAELNSNKTAYEQFGNKMTFAETYRNSEYLAAWLQNQVGIKPGDRVAIMMPNCPQYPIAIFAILKAGASVVNVNPLYTSHEVQHVLEETSPTVMIIWNGCAAHVEQAINSVQDIELPRQIIVTGLGDMLPSYKGAPLNMLLRLQGKVKNANISGAVGFTQALRSGSAMNFYRPTVKGSDIAFLQLTGGTTGKPKAAILTHRNLVANIMQAKFFISPDFTAQDKEQRIAITALPLYHIFALMANGLLFFHLGINNILIANPRDIKGLIKTIGNYKFHGIDAVNTLFKAMLANPGFASIDFSNLVLTLGGGMAVQKEVAEQWRQVTGCVLNQAYGLTEASPAVAINPHTAKKFTGSIGLPLPSTEVAILDDKKRPLPQGKEGLLFVRGPQVMAGYWKKREATSQDLSLDGWLNTGDIAYLDKKGYLYIVDRAKDVIIVSGFNVYPNEVEEVVDSYEKVIESGCIGVKDSHSGEAVKVFVVLKPGVSCTEEEIIAHCKKTLTGYKTPDKVEFVNELPKSPVGKILRRELN